MFFIIILILIAVFLANQIRIVPQQTCFVIERLGKYYTEWEAGLHIKTPVIDKMVKKISLKEKVYAYYWENEHNRAVKWIICNTSLANIYYDTLRKKWGITKKEQKKANNMRIEAIDTDDIESQLFRRYHVNNLEELQKKLAQSWKTKTDRKASAC